jgi:hypothetical protein
MMRIVKETGQTDYVNVKVTKDDIVSNFRAHKISIILFYFKLNVFLWSVFSSLGCCYFCCWPYLKYIIATRLGETPFMALIPCAVFALRIKVRTLFGIKV